MVKRSLQAVQVVFLPRIDKETLTVCFKVKAEDLGGFVFMCVTESMSVGLSGMKKIKQLETEG